jgi:hypothetical protein
VLPKVLETLVARTLALVDAEPELQAWLRKVDEPFTQSEEGLASVLPSGKHARQHASILAHLRRSILNGRAPGASGECFVEMGCGKAGLSLHVLEESIQRGLKPSRKRVRTACPTATASDEHADKVSSDAVSRRAPLSLPSHILVDRMTFRSTAKADSRMRGATFAAAERAGAVIGGGVRRVVADIADLSLAALREEAIRASEEGPGATKADSLGASRCSAAAKGSPPLVIISKHLCGPATDLSLRLLAAEHEGVSLAVGTCCHHLLELGCCVNADFFADAGLGTADVAILAKASSWATLKTATDDDLERGCSPGGLEGASTASCVEQPLPLSAAADAIGMPRAERRRFGRACKLLFDWSRALWLRKKGFRHVQLVRYVPYSVSLESTLLLAW